MSWLVAPLCTWLAACSEISDTAPVRARTSGGTGLPWARPLRPISSGTKRSASQQETMVSAAGREIRPACACATARAPSASSIAPIQALPETASANLSGTKIGLNSSPAISRTRRTRSVRRPAGGCRSAEHPLRHGDESPPKLPVLDGREDGVCSVRLLLVREVDACHQARQKTTGEDGDHDVRRLKLAVRIGNGPGLDRREGELAALTCARAPEAREVFVEGQVLPVVSGMIVAASPVGLPDLDHRVGDGLPFPVVDGAIDPYRLGMIRRDQLGAVSVEESVVKEGAYRLGRCWLGAHLWFSIGVAALPSSTMSNL